MNDIMSYAELTTEQQLDIIRNATGLIKHLRTTDPIYAHLTHYNDTYLLDEACDYLEQRKNGIVPFVPNHSPNGEDCAGNGKGELECQCENCEGYPICFDE